MFSLTVSRSIALKSCGRTPIRFRISAWSERLLTSKPRTLAWPPVGFLRHSRISTVVVFPAPFGPRKAKTSPLVRLKDIPFTATFSPYFFDSFSTWTISSDLLGIERSEERRVGKGDDGGGRRGVDEKEVLKF